MKRSPAYDLMVLGSLLLIGGCGSSGGGDSNDVEDPVVVVTEVVLRGQFEANSNTVRILVDGTPATLVGSTWSCPVALTGPERMVTVSLEVGGTVVAIREVSVTY